jgi:hypothetical protein
VKTGMIILFFPICPRANAEKYEFVIVNLIQSGPIGDIELHWM